MLNSISFQPFFVQAFKIVVDSWKLTVLLLYILWGDWIIFRISNSNQQLQQQLEYTLLKPDCHCWWISKMQSGREDTLEEPYVTISVCEWHKRFKEGRESLRDGERCWRNKEVNTLQLIVQRVRVRVTMLSSGKNSVGRGQHSSNRLSGISSWTIHQSTTPSLSQTIWPKWASRQLLSLPLVKSLLPVIFGYSLSSEAVVMRLLRRWKRLWRRSFTHSHKRTSMGRPEVVRTV